MRSIRRIPLTRALWFCLLSAPLWSLAGMGSAPPRDDSTQHVARPTRHRSPSEEARRRGWRYWIEAQQVAIQQGEALEAWDPAVRAAGGWVAARQHLVSQDRGGLLHRARTAAQQASLLARTPAETEDAILLRARIECDLGNHDAELHQARLLVARKPYSQTALRILLRAADCTGSRSLAAAIQQRLLRQASPGHDPMTAPPLLPGSDNPQIGRRARE